MRVRLTLPENGSPAKYAGGLDPHAAGAVANTLPAIVSIGLVSIG